MNVAGRIIACLDVKRGRVVKGVQFKELRDLGDPVELARRYDAEGIDELVFLDITATDENRSTQEAWVSAVARTLSIPFTVGGGVRGVADIRRLLRAGADKVAINTQAVLTPEMIDEAAAEFGSQCVVIAMDVAKDAALGHRVFIRAGKERTELSLDAWTAEVVRRGAGEILLTSIDRDGTGDGFDLDALRTAAKSSVPVVASGGAGTEAHFADALRAGASGVLAATLFHEAILSPARLKAHLLAEGIRVRPVFESSP
ncbi:MAG: imidazole glycerol phosphate synthase subunit HisF [Polyangiaceae bacterium]|nr:imidazole glycerol phosphate synthase subunit HisF [Polyangiaceae bacterium]